jgi:hypothetical protein
MALEIVKRLIVVTKQGNNSTSVSTDYVEDTYANRNAALKTLGFENTTGKDPDITKKQFTEDMLDLYPNIISIRIDDCIKDTVTSKYYYTFEIDPRKYEIESFWVAPETKNKDMKDRKEEKENAI